MSKKPRKVKMQEPTLADWWAITKAFCRLDLVGSVVCATLPNGEYVISLGDPNHIKNWVEEMNYLYEYESEMFD